MKKKGFTLVELLAVIAILAILVIIALPNVMGMFNSAKKKSFITELQRIYRGAENEYVKDAFNSSGKRVYSKCANGCTNELDMQIRDDLEYYIEISSKGKVVKYYAHDNSYQFGYEGEMEVTDIKDASDISTVSESEKITIVSSTPFVGGNEVVSTEKIIIDDGFGPEIVYIPGMTWREWLNSGYNSELNFRIGNKDRTTDFYNNVVDYYLENDAEGISTGEEAYYCGSNQYLTSYNLLYNLNTNSFVSPDDTISNSINYTVWRNMC